MDESQELDPFRPDGVTPQAPARVPSFPAVSHRKPRVVFDSPVEQFTTAEIEAGNDEEPDSCMSNGDEESSSASHKVLVRPPSTLPPSCRRGRICFENAPAEAPVAAVPSTGETTGTVRKTRFCLDGLEDQEMEDNPPRDTESMTIKKRLRVSVRSLLHGPLLTEDTRPWHRKVWILLEEPGIHPVAWYMHFFYSIMIMMSVATTIAQTMPQADEATMNVVKSLDLVFNITFCLDVLLRVVCSPLKRALLRNMYMWMDIGAILPFLVSNIGRLDMKNNKFLELLSLLVPILRLLKITRHSLGWRILVISIGKCLSPLGVPLFLLVLVTVFASCIIFWVEKHMACTEDECSDQERPAFQSIPHAMWFSITTICTVGYGDVTPHSYMAKVMSALLMIVGSSYMAMPLAIIGGTFVSVWDDRDRIVMREKTKSRLAEGGITHKEVQQLFNAANIDGSGQLTMNEFVGMVKAFQLPLTHAQILRLYRTVDINGDSKISYEEFASFLFPEMEMTKDHVKEEEPYKAWVDSIVVPDADDSGGEHRPLPRSPRGVLQAPKPTSPGSSKANEALLQRFESVEGRLTRLETLVEGIRDEQSRHFEALREMLEAMSTRLPQRRRV